MFGDLLHWLRANHWKHVLFESSFYLGIAIFSADAIRDPCGEHFRKSLVLCFLAGSFGDDSFDFCLTFDSFGFLAVVGIDTGPEQLTRTFSICADVFQVDLGPRTTLIPNELVQPTESELEPDCDVAVAGNSDITNQTVAVVDSVTSPCIRDRFEFQ